VSSPHPSIPLSYEALAADLCRQSFAYFVRMFWSTIPGTGKLVWNWHLEVICNELQEIAERVFKGQAKDHDLVINISPGTSKSSLISILFSGPWTWTRMPDARHLIASHTSDLVLDLSSKARDVVRSELYRKLFPEIELREDTDSKGHYRNTCGGERKICTVSGVSPLGFHGHFCLVDDALDPKGVLSDVRLKVAKQFIEEILPSRMVDKSITPIILVMQRLGLGDPTEVMLKGSLKEGAYPVRHLCLPAELTDEVKPVELRKFYVNGLMDPIRLSQRVLNNYLSKGKLYYDTQFLQKPYAREGSMFRPQWFSQRVKAAPFNAQRVRYWDRASTAASLEGKGCFTAGTLLARDEQGKWYVEHVVHGQWEPDERNDIMRATALRDRTRYGPKNEPTIWIEAEGGSSGRDAWRAIARHLAGFRVFEDRVTGKKDTRAEPWASQLASGNVWVVDNGESAGTGRADWDVEGFIAEHVAFKPDASSNRLGRYKDIVDSVSGAFNILTGRSGRITHALRIVKFGLERGKPLQKIVCCSRQELMGVEIHDHPTLLFCLYDPSPDVNGALPPHGLSKLLEGVNFTFGDIDPSEYQEKWNIPLPEYNDLMVDEVKMTVDHGKKLWSTITKKRDPMWQVLILCDEGGEDRRAFSLALGICDSLHLNRSSAIHLFNQDVHVTPEQKPPNKHLYDLVRISRNMVI